MKKVRATPTRRQRIDMMLTTAIHLAGEVSAILASTLQALPPEKVQSDARAKEILGAYQHIVDMMADGYMARLPTMPDIEKILFIRDSLRLVNVAKSLGAYKTSP
jgi:phage tail sheath gpL-like